MTEPLRNWLEERETIHGKAEGEWWTTRDLRPPTVFAGDGSADDVAVVTGFEVNDAKAIVDAHNTLPKLLAGVKEVLELHQPDQNGNCGECIALDHGTWNAYRLAHPCSTVQKLQEAIKND